MSFRRQLPLFQYEDGGLMDVPFPTTRYQGSKRRLSEWLWEQLREDDFHTVLDIFGGTGVISHMFKRASTVVTYNDHLRFNHYIGTALIENSSTYLEHDDVQKVITRRDDIEYPRFIQATFKDIYYTEDENKWLDMAVTNIETLFDNPYKKALAYFALFQACIIKRPFNLFHRRNLSMRQRKVRRSFGNKATWDTPFEVHYPKFVKQANEAIFDNGQDNKAICVDAFDAPTDVDLIYIDPPFINEKGLTVDFREYYHFLEGMVNYDKWAEMIDYETRILRLARHENVWNDPHQNLEAFGRLFERYKNSMIVMSYRADGFPTREQLLDLLAQYKDDVTVLEQDVQFVLSKKRSTELLIIAR